MLSILKQVLKTKNDWGLKPLILGSFYELAFLIRHPGFKYFFVIEPQDLDISGEDSKLSDPYVPTPYFILTKSLNKIKQFIGNLQNSVFIDIGCGPGRALYYSSLIGFNRLIGIEQSKKLADMCNENLRRYLSPRTRAAIINQNVRDVDFRDLINDAGRGGDINALVFFLYAPFKDQMLQILLNKFDELDVFDCFIIYFGPQNESIILQKHFAVVFADYGNKDTPIKIYSRKKCH